jgi:hypothetical protein
MENAESAKFRGKMKRKASTLHDLVSLGQISLGPFLGALKHDERFGVRVVRHR